METNVTDNIDELKRSSIKGELMPIVALLNKLHNLREVEIHRDECDLLIKKILINL